LIRDVDMNGDSDDEADGEEKFKPKSGGDREGG
jgi:hypothetical protein